MAPKKELGSSKVCAHPTLAHDSELTLDGVTGIGKTVSRKELRSKRPSVKRTLRDVRRTLGDDAANE